MSPIYLVVLLQLGAPARLVVGLRGPDLRRGPQRARVTRWEGQLGAVEVRRLAFAVSIDVPDEAATRRRLLHDPNVRWVEREVYFPIRFKSVPNDPLFGEQWPLHPQSGVDPAANIDVEAAWDTTTGKTPAGNPVIIGVIDDGFDLTHPDLSFTPGAEDFSAYPSVDGDPAAGGTQWHGTWTAGTAAARGFNGIGVCGVCPSCNILPIGLTANGGPPDLFISGSAAAAAIDWAWQHGAAVINNSWGPPDGNPLDPGHPTTLWPEADPTSGRPAGVLPQVLVEALTRAVTLGRGGLGSVITWAAGNGNELVTYDRFASDPRVMAISAIDSRAQHAYYSDFGPPIFVAAPSSGDASEPAVTTTDLQGAAGADPGDYTSTFGGTSAAAAEVAGVAALIIAARPDLTAAQVEEALALGAVPVDTRGGSYVDGRSPYYGFGRVDAAASIAVAESYPVPNDGCTHGLELCGNGIDDDCNGVVDDPDRCTPCIPDAPQELCDGRDNNCDGHIDEGFVCEATNRPICAPCTSSLQCTPNALCRTSPDFAGSWCFATCGADGSCPAGFACNGEVCLLTPSASTASCADYLDCNQPERCDGKDDDCNGIIDDVAASSPERAAQAAECSGPGVCAHSGAACIDGTWQCTRPPHWQAVETLCDGLDNDCNGIIDDPPVCAKHGCSCTTWGVDSWPAGLLAGLVALSRRRRSRKRHWA